MPDSIRIYFAGSIRGGRVDVQIYRELIDYLRERAEVLNVHIGDSQLTSRGESLLDDACIFNRDRDWITASDALVAEVSQPSLGVGYEIGFAESCHMPILVLFRENKHSELSAMIAGNPRVRTIRYQHVHTAKQALSEFLAALKARPNEQVHGTADRRP